MRGDFESIHSLQAVDRWVQVINGNLNAVNRVGYKSSQVKFKGGVTDSVRNPQGALQGIQIPETTLQVDQTSIDFSQGSIINSDEPTHLALRGRGFFRLKTGDPLSAEEFFTRDGEFHSAFNANFGTEVLTNSSGLVLVDNSGPPNFAVTTGTVTANTITLQAFIANAFSDNIYDTNTPQLLQFSRYGSTVFEDPFLATTPITSDQATLGVPPTPVISQALESSNASLSQAVPELSLAQKFFSAVSKVISVHQNNLDTTLNLIR